MTQPNPEFTKPPTFEDLQQELGVVEPGPPGWSEDLSGGTPPEE